MEKIADAKIRRQLVEGVGVNDADYQVKIVGQNSRTADGRRIQKYLWECPFYSRWKGMLRRCYNSRYKATRPTYAGCSVVDSWLVFSNFKSWMEKQDWQGKEIDKDLLVPGNKLYGPDTCVFIDRAVNVFLTERKGDRSAGLVGVYQERRRRGFKANCQDVDSGRQIYLGRFATAEEAHEAWRKFKLSQALILAARQSDPRVAAALIARYQAQEAQEAA
ncbi:hypothetical protein [Pseudomonas sp. JUb52]|uniref:hypothetical protein n=1 Tax=Pseudomonas sp. JUb52 TaxID=2485127 RepID=UPI0010480BE8|nr:hypothetical protein [Pseudomonas sp. JUb52]TCQ94073.1 hypothetical protein EC839_101194 [Pseudomonas sp. JUb52]